MSDTRADTNPDRRAAPAPAGPSANPVLRGPVLLAIHGGESTPAAIDAAQLLASRVGRELHVVTVVEAVSAIGAPPDVLPTLPTDASRVVEQASDVVRQRLRDALGAQAKWTLNVRVGSPGREISRAARECNATLVIVDAAPRRGVRHVVAGVRALQVVAQSACPVLSVSPSFPRLPATILAPIDFSPASLRAAQAALLLAADGARLLLVHCPMPLYYSHTVLDQSGGLVSGDVALFFERAKAQLAPYAPAGVTIDMRTIEGSPVSEVLSIAEAIQADLIAVGTHGHGSVERLFVGSVAAGLLHNAPCPVLVAPPP
jgi:nucleotide-binding universal stress UspA family protein